MPLREQYRIQVPAPEPSAPPKCEPWCGGELCPGTGSEFCKCLDVDRYFCTRACQAAEQPMRPCQPVPAHEAWMLRRMANGWKEHANQVADVLASRFGQPSAPPAVAPECQVWCGKIDPECVQNNRHFRRTGMPCYGPGSECWCSWKCSISNRSLNPPRIAPVATVTGGVPTKPETGGAR